MAKIGILTFHRSYNYGAFIQCYSLCQQLQKDFSEHDIEVIDYATERVYQNYPTKVIDFILGSKDNRNSFKRVIKNIAKLLLDRDYLKRKRVLYNAFEEDIEFLPVSSQRIISDDYMVFFEKIKDLYDIIIVGSDSVWEFKTYPFPNVYFLNYDFDKSFLMSYAASSGRMQYSELNDFEKEYIKEAFARFSYLGVRDKSTEMFITSTDDNCKYSHNCDPTVLLDLTQMPRNLDRIKNELKDNGINIERPIICVMGGDSVCKFVRKMFGKKYQIVAVYYYSKYADYYINYLRPTEWAQVFSLFSVTVTRFFHGSLLSLKNGCPTIATDYWYKGKESQTTKIHDLYKRLDLEEHYFYMPDINTDEGLQEIKERIEFFIENPNTEDIYNALLREAQSYDSFKNEMEKLLMEV